MDAKCGISRARSIIKRKCIDGIGSKLLYPLPNHIIPPTSKKKHNCWTDFWHQSTIFRDISWFTMSSPTISLSENQSRTYLKHDKQMLYELLVPTFPIVCLKFGTSWLNVLIYTNNRIGNKIWTSVLDILLIQFILRVNPNNHIELNSIVWNFSLYIKKTWPVLPYNGFIRCRYILNKLYWLLLKFLQYLQFYIIILLIY